MAAAMPLETALTNETHALENLKGDDIEQAEDTTDTPPYEASELFAAFENFNSELKSSLRSGDRTHSEVEGMRRSNIARSEAVVRDNRDATNTLEHPFNKND